MFSIAVCDDEKMICSQIEKIILNYAVKNGYPNLVVESLTSY